MGGIAGFAGLLGAAVTVGAVALSAPAAADDTVTIHGTAFPSSAAAQLSLVGCADLYARSPEELRPYISLGNSPAGKRSLGYDLAGGNAMGSLHLVDSMTSTAVASLDVKAPGGAAGVAYAGYQEPLDAGTDLVWFGRAQLLAPAGGWATYDAAQLVYTWTKYDMSTQVAVPETLFVRSGITSTVREFVTSRGGDGPGLYTIGFGCDGSPFTMDTMRVGTFGAVTTFDLEGLRTATSMDGTGAQVTAGERLTLGGAVRTDSGSRVPHATVVLEQRSSDSRGWRRVDVVSADPRDPSVVVEPTHHTTYRWRFVDRPVAEGSVSPAYDVSVAPRVQASTDGDPVGSVTGRTFPAKPGAIATLWQLGEGASERIGQATIGKDGTFSIDVPRGTSGRFVVTTTADDDHLAGTSGPLMIDAPEAAAPATAPSSPSEPSSPSQTPSSPTPESSASAAAVEPTATATATEEPTALETAASSLAP